MTSARLNMPPARGGDTPQGECGECGECFYGFHRNVALGTVLVYRGITDSPDSPPSPVSEAHIPRCLEMPLSSDSELAGFRAKVLSTSTGIYTAAHN